MLPGKAYCGERVQWGKALGEYSVEIIQNTVLKIGVFTGCVSLLRSLWYDQGCTVSSSELLCTSDGPDCGEHEHQTSWAGVSIVDKTN